MSKYKFYNLTKRGINKIDVLKFSANVSIYTIIRDMDSADDNEHLIYTDFNIVRIEGAAEFLNSCCDTGDLNSADVYTFCMSDGKVLSFSGSDLIDFVKNADVICPECGRVVWDVAFAGKLNKCWDCGIVFD